MKNQLLELLTPFGQEHLLAFWDELSESSRQNLAEQIQNVDFEQITELYKNRDAVVDVEPFSLRGKEPPAYKLGILSDGNPSRNEAIAIGEKAISSGKYAVVLVAGGQGTRLGFDHPKGMYPIGPVSGATLFQIHLHKTLAVAKKYNVAVPICIMTSPATHDETVAFLDQNDWFGISQSNRFIFSQGTMPAVDLETGKILLAAKDSLTLGPDGHGGMLAAINRKNSSGEPSILEQLHDRGIENLFYFQVDNPFVDICNPEFIGYHISSVSELTSQVIRKKNPTDRVGNIVELDGKLHVIEYSDIPQSLAEKRLPDGSLAIWAGSIAVHQFNIGFLSRVAPIASALPFHIARKKVAYVAANGEMVYTKDPNAIKFERFIFDLMPSAKNAVVVEVDIPHNYGPLKNAPGSPTDSPETVKSQLIALHTEWLRQVGATVVAGTAVEISPLTALNADDLRGKIPSGMIIDRPTVL